MSTYPSSTVAVIFVSERTLEDDEGYGEAADAMVALAKQQPGYLGVDSARGDDRIGITVSYWADDTSAKAWRDNAEHAAIREAGRDRWYRWYDLHVASVTRSYDWVKR